MAEMTPEESAAWDGEILNDIAKLLKRFGCKCGPDAHAGTPPMMYPEWLACVVRSAEAKRTDEAAKIAHAFAESEFNQHADARAMARQIEAEILALKDKTKEI